MTYRIELNPKSKPTDQRITTQRMLLEIDEVELKFTTSKIVIIKEVLYTPKRLALLKLHELANLFTLIKNNIYVTKRYATNGMFKLNLEMNKIQSSYCHVNK